MPTSSLASGFFRQKTRRTVLPSATRLGGWFVNFGSVGVDTTDTFALVLKPGMIRAMLQLVVSRAWPVHQLDVSNAFLHGYLTEQVFCEQPTGFIVPRTPTSCTCSPVLFTG